MTPGELGTGQANEQHVLEHPTAQSDCGDPSIVPEVISGFGDQPSDRFVETCGHRARGAALADVFHDGP
jgi:hypothetical protein